MDRIARQPQCLTGIHPDKRQPTQSLTALFHGYYFFIILTTSPAPSPTSQVLNEQKYGGTLFPHHSKTAKVTKTSLLQTAPLLNGTSLANPAVSTVEMSLLHRGFPSKAENSTNHRDQHQEPRASSLTFGARKRCQDALEKPVRR